MDHADWVSQVLKNLDGAGPDGKKAFDYIEARKVQIGFSKQDPATAAKWTLGGNIDLNPDTYSDATQPDDAYMLSLIAHEALHLQQGLLTALSVYGELQAWQLQFRLIKAIDAAQIDPAQQAFLDLPLNWDRANLEKAADMMVAYAPGYKIHWLPLYPLFKEIRYQLTRQVPE